MANTSPPTYQGTDEAVRRWSQSLAQYLNATFLDLYKITDRTPIIKVVPQVSASGTTPIGGLGFRPSCAIIVAGTSGLDAVSWGFDDGTQHQCRYAYLDGSNVSQQNSSTSYSVYLRDSGGSNVLLSYVSVISDDGLTVTSALTGTVAASMRLLVFP